MALFTDKTVLVTGSAAGIGRATALGFAAQGANVVVSDIDQPGGEETVAMIHKADGTAMFQRADVSNVDDVAALVASAVDQYGGLDCAVNNAGIEGTIAPFTDQTEANYDAIMRVNTKGAFLCMQAEIRHMLAAGGGAIVNVSSVAGLIGFPGLSPYVASKHAIAGLTRNAALEYAKGAIRVNAVCPGGIDTRMLDSLAEQATSGAQTSQQMMDPLHPIGRIGTAVEVANLIIWLCSGQASFMVGAIIPVDGGFVAQ